MSDAVVIAIFTGMIGLTSTAFTAWMAYLVARLNKLTVGTSAKLTSIDQTTKVTKSLVNHQAIAGAKLYAIQCRRIANLTVGSPSHVADERDATEAEKALHDLVQAQAEVDGKAPELPTYDPNVTGQPR